MALEDDHYCYACGSDNPEGFRLTFVQDGQTLSTDVTFRREHQGYARMVHGGFLALLLDEVMVNLPCRVLGRLVVSVRLTVRLRKPVAPGQRITCTATLVSHRKRKYELKAVAILPDGQVAAEATSTCLSV